MNKLKIGLVGCGGVAGVHLDSYSKMDDVVVEAVVDIIEEKAIAMREKYKAAIHFTDYNELMDKKDIDIIDVCVPTYLHADVAIKAARSGKHVFCEKPIAMNIKDADKMIEACRKAGVKFTVGFCRRFDNEWLKFKELIDKNAIGTPVIWRQVSAFGDMGDPWYFDLKKSGGPFLDGGIHSLDFAGFVFGPVAAIFADTMIFRKNTTAPDTGTVMIKFKSGDELILLWTWGLPAGCEGTDLQDALGPAGIIIFPPASDPLKVDASKPGNFAINRGKEGKNETVTFTRNNMYFDELRHFIDCVRYNREPRVSGEEAREALRVGLAVLNTAKAGEMIKY